MRALTELKKLCFNLASQSRCFCCHEDKKKRLLLHHLSYNNDSVVYNKFENSDYGRLKYYANLIDEIKFDPTNFLVVCFDCHSELEGILKNNINGIKEIFRNNPNKVNKFLDACKATLARRGYFNLFGEATYDNVYSPNYFNNLYQIDSVDEAKQFLENIHELSLSDYSYTAELSFNLDDYIDDRYYHIQAAKQLTNIRDIKKGDRISYIRTINRPYAKPIELANKCDVDIKYYENITIKWFARELKIDEAKLRSDGLDEYFWS
jgi:hypothetical protein